MKIHRKKKIKKLKNINNNIYINKKEFTDIPFMKNKEIINAVNNYSINKENLFSYNLNKRKNYAFNLHRNLRLKNISKSQNIVKTKSLGPEFNIIKILKNKLLNSQKEEKNMKRKILRMFSNINDNRIKNDLLTIKNKEINEKKYNILNQQNNTRNNSLNQFSIAHFEFPAIDSYFY